MTRPDPTLPPLIQLPERPEDIEAVDPQSQSDSTDVKEVWFAGCHSDVGGGHGDPDDSNTLSDPSLCWMINQTIISGVPIRFDTKALDTLQGFTYVPANPLPTPPKDGSPTEPTRNFNSNLLRVQQRDVESSARSCIHDELGSNRLWWAPELLPFRTSTPDRTGKTWRQMQYTLNVGDGRKIYEPDVLIHNSVKLRMEKGYQPAAIFRREDVRVQYVDDLNKDMGEGHIDKGHLVLEGQKSIGSGWPDFFLWYATIMGAPWQYVKYIPPGGQAPLDIALQ
ncbi:hypothetical protein FRC00_000737 [Tulasnella sp. 408]|nr:hypothetical protein FRC00_000737 [Tulasnella sp. 408]